MSNINLSKRDILSKNCELLGAFLAEKFGFGSDVIDRFRGNFSTLVMALALLNLKCSQKLCHTPAATGKPHCL
jgi:hypothetical protein